jgi:hypothetical protein
VLPVRMILTCYKPRSTQHSMWLGFMLPGHRDTCLVLSRTPGQSQEPRGRAHPHQK